MATTPKIVVTMSHPVPNPESAAEGRVGDWAGEGGARQGSHETAPSGGGGGGALSGPLSVSPSASAFSTLSLPDLAITISGRRAVAAAGGSGPASATHSEVLSPTSPGSPASAGNWSGVDRRSGRPSTITSAASSFFGQFDATAIAMPTRSRSARGDGSAGNISARTSVVSAFSPSRTSSAGSVSVRSLTSFEGSLVRLTGVPLHRVFRGACRVFSSKWRPKQAIHREEVSKLDFFISHNWSVHRAWKFIALSLYFNLKIAIIFAFAVCLVLVVASLFYTFPGVPHPFLDGAEIGYLCQCLVGPLLLLGVFAAGSLRRGCGRQVTVFLDRLCIDQFDLELKQQGIMRLGAFIKYSERMIILHTDVYFERLWTVYEVAAFLTLHELDALQVLQLDRSMAFAICLVLACLSNVALLAVMQWPMLRALARFVLYAIGVYAVRSMQHKKKASLEKLQHFTLAQCTCADERDRPLVYNNIATLVRSVCRASDTSDEEALAAFETMVKQTLPLCLGRGAVQVFTYRQHLLLGFIVYGVTIFDALTRPDSMKLRCILILNCITNSFAILPFCGMAMEFMAHLNINTRGWKEAVYVVVVILAFSALVTSLQIGLYFLTHWSADSDVWLACFLFVSVAFAVITWRFRQSWVACPAISAPSGPTTAATPNPVATAKQQEGRRRSFAGSFLFSLVNRRKDQVRDSKESASTADSTSSMLLGQDLASRSQRLARTAEAEEEGDEEEQEVDEDADDEADGKEGRARKSEEENEQEGEVEKEEENMENPEEKEIKGTFCTDLFSAPLVRLTV